jgi:CheY-like chemotaxis protein
LGKAIDETVHVVRRISAELRPGVLDDLGLAAAIEWQAQDFEKREALAQVWKKPWELVLLDISMHGRSGLDILKEIRASASRVPALVLSAHPEEQYAIRVLKAGAGGVPHQRDRTPRTVPCGEEGLERRQVRHADLSGTPGGRSSVVG